MEKLLAISQDISRLLSGADISPLYVEHFTREAARKTHDDKQLPAGVRQVVDSLQGLRQVTQIYHVDSAYYSWPLHQRALCILAPSAEHLCKTVVLENKKWRPDDPRSGPQHICVLVQYTQSIDTGALADFVRSQLEDPLARKHFNYRLTSPEKSFELTGFSNNAVSPIGMTHQLPIVLCESIARLQPPVFWLGAGHIDYKLAMPVDHFIKATACMVADVSN
ncbi:hypothetical protein FBU31_004343 [Coemansia sp. 'formosensis']|nr:hypothetical protein FBU31_004343 [Coemansia sp. 'formosensis']